MKGEKLALNKGKLFVISAPSGTGKTTLINAMVASHISGCPLKQVITYTTRKPRTGEINGVDYYFITIEDFKQKIQEGFFLEWSNWYHNYYGSARSILYEVAHGARLIIILDRQGAKSVRKIYPLAELIWIQPPSLELLKSRLIQRGDDPQAIEVRLKKAAIELEQEKNDPFYDHVIINHSLEQTLIDLKALICLKK